MNTATSDNSTPPPSSDCPVLPLAREYERLAARLLGEDDDATFYRLRAISDEASYLNPTTTTSSAFQIMLVGAEADLALESSDTRGQREASRAKISRLLYRALDFMLAADELPNAREYAMRKDLDPKNAKVDAASPEIADEMTWDGDAQSDAGHLHDLLDVAVSGLVEVDHVKSDGSRNAELAQLVSLCWVARDLAGRLRDNLASAA